MKKLCIALALAALAGGCAKTADKVAPAYVSPLQYDHYDCKQIELEAGRITTRVAALTGAQNKQASSDVMVTTVGVIVFWPALFFVGGDDAQTYELARLKGEMDAVEAASIAKNCPITFERPKPPTAEQLRQMKE
ncbi:hypothetical protein AncyloWKF20_05490 [Ancylobacter sp. WKF20]|uniref:hypothetical protein n=1 Tax=Ancylobacter sp. WKF20 TaxID=3039801 RepID=UPI00243454AA|nr:hypothetical protein [Ancylobacter sp. WKF20]WGD31278.1 hypothetical protein AncyloWKF20_05490 [Ancylobacter sp. WKF20]